MNIQELVLQPLLGGVLIGIAVSILLVTNGRVTGIAGIVNGLLTYVKGDMSWRVAFVGGLALGGLVLAAVLPEALENTSGRPLAVVAGAGLIVGFSTIMGSGCTSGHGVCGISRLSPRSIIATVVFMGTGFLSVFLYRTLVGG